MKLLDLDLCTKLLQFLKAHPEGALINDILQAYPYVHRARLSRYLTYLERQRKLVFRVKVRTGKRGLPPDRWFYGRVASVAKQEEGSGRSTEDVR